MRGYARRRWNLLRDGPIKHYSKNALAHTAFVVHPSETDRYRRETGYQNLDVAVDYQTIGLLGKRSSDDERTWWMQHLAHAQMLRHACGYKLANDGHDTRAIQAYLEHRNIQNTTLYRLGPC
jgi:Phage integrase family